MGVDEVVRDFALKWGLEEHHLAEIRKEFETALETGSDEKKKQEVDYLNRTYAEIGFIRLGRLGGGGFGDIYTGLDLKTKEIVEFKDKPGWTVKVGYFGSQLFCCNCDSWKEICQRSIFWNS